MSDNMDWIDMALMQGYEFLVYTEIENTHNIIVGCCKDWLTAYRMAYSYVDKDNIASIGIGDLESRRIITILPIKW